MTFKTIFRKFKGIDKIIKELPDAYAYDAFNRRHALQFGYLDDILFMKKVNTVVAEEYIDRHFIDDFCGHYGRCFRDYEKKCIRLHFFTNHFDETSFQKTICSDLPDDDKKKALGTYVGFIVIRPVSSALLANVCLSAPFEDVDTLIRKKVIAHLYGMELSVDTVPFQEQDNAISACATSALWSALHAFLDNRPQEVPSPHKITQNARKIIPEGLSSREIKKGLTIPQMAHAVQMEHLDSLCCLYASMSYTKALIRAYLNIGIPIVLGIELYYRSDELSKGMVSRIIGNHAVTVLGYDCGYEIKQFHVPDNNKPKNKTIPLYLESSSINRIYCHDDQIGPYSPMTIPDEYCMALETQWDKDGDHGPVDARIYSILIPSHHKIRIRFSSIYKIVKALNVAFFDDYYLSNLVVTWDIRLETGFSIKNKIKNLPSDILDIESKMKLLATHFPRFIWVIDQLVTENDDNLSYFKVASFFLDATDIENSDLLIKAIHYSKDSFTLNQAILSGPDASRIFAEAPVAARHILECYTDKADTRIVTNNLLASGNDAQDGIGENLT